MSNLKEWMKIVEEGSDSFDSDHSAENLVNYYDDEQEERDELVRKYYPKLEGKERNCGCGQTPCKTYGRQNEGIVEGKALTEAEFDEAAGKKDACYHKVKARYKVWPSAYASGALVQCRKKGAANWGNSKKK